MTDKIKSVAFNFPVLAILGILPLVVYRMEVRTYLEDNPVRGLGYYTTDFFLYCKEIFFLALVIGMVAILFTAILGGKKVIWEHCFWLLVIYGVGGIVSTIFSQYQEVSLRGGIGLFQSVFVLLGYWICFYYGASIVNWRKLSLRALKCSVVVISYGMTILGISQLCGMDLLSSKVAQVLLGGRQASHSGFAYLTLYHWNYTGSFCVLVLPLLAVFYVKAKEKGKKLCYGGAFLGIIICLGASCSRTGKGIFFLICLLSLLLYKKQVRKYWKRIVLLAMGIVGIFVLCNVIVLGNPLGKWDEIRYESGGSKKFKSIVTRDDGVAITFKKENYILKIEGQGENIVPSLQLEKKQEQLPLVWENSSGYFDVAGLRVWKLSIWKDTINGKTIYGIAIKYKKRLWRFTNQYKEGTYYYKNIQNRYDRAIQAPTALPQSMDEIFSLRGFVWSRTIPCIQNHILVGSGPDTFIFEFPNNDYAARYRYKLLTTVYNKAHNQFLQSSVEVGLIPTLGLFLFWVLYLIKLARYIRKNRDSLVVGIYLGTMAYLLTQCFQDSMIVLAPFFYLIGGIGYGMTSFKKK